MNAYVYRGLCPAESDLLYLLNASKLAMYGVELHQAKVFISSFFLFVVVVAAVVVVAVVVAGSKIQKRSP